MKKLLKSSIASLLFTLLITSCLKKVEYPPVPAIQFESFEITSNGASTQADLTISFTDGDGDIGLKQEDTTGIFCSDTCLYHYNLFCEYYEKLNGEWIHYPIDWQNGATPFYYRLPDITPTGQNPSLAGKIIINMPTYYLLTTPGDTCRFEVKIVDRALNESNTVTTTEFTKPG